MDVLIGKLVLCTLVVSVGGGPEQMSGFLASGPGRHCPSPSLHFSNPIQGQVRLSSFNIIYYNNAIMRCVCFVHV